MVPEAVPGWTLETEVIETELYQLFGETRSDRVSLVRWTGGPLPTGQFLDLGIGAVFTTPQEQPSVFPLVRGAASTSGSGMRWRSRGRTGRKLAFPASLVTFSEPPETDLDTLQVDLGELRAHLQALRQQDGLRIGQLPGARMRARLADFEARIEAIEDQLEKVASQRRRLAGPAGSATVGLPPRGCVEIRQLTGSRPSVRSDR